MYADLRSWRAVGKKLGVSPALAWKYARDPDYEPKRADLRHKLGLDNEETVTYIRQVRRQDGTFRRKQ